MTSTTTSGASGNLLVHSAQLTGKALSPLLARTGGLLFGLHLLEVLASQFFTYGAEYVRNTGREDILPLASLALGEMAFMMLWSTAWLIAIAGPAKRLWQGEIIHSTGHHYAVAFSRFFNQMTIEQVRAFAAVLWRVPLLLIPAFNEYVRLTFVPIVVICDDAYAEGKVDALQDSRRLAKGDFWKLSLVVSMAALAPWIAQSLAQGDGSDLIWENPIGVALGWLAQFFINIIATVYLCAFYHEVRARKNSSAALGSTIVESRQANS